MRGYHNCHGSMTVVWRLKRLNLLIKSMLTTQSNMIEFTIHLPLRFVCCPVYSSSTMMKTTFTVLRPWLGLYLSLFPSTASGISTLILRRVVIEILRSRVWIPPLNCFVFQALWVAILIEPKFELSSLVCFFYSCFLSQKKRFYLFYHIILWNELIEITKLS